MRGLSQPWLLRFSSTGTLFPKDENRPRPVFFRFGLKWVKKDTPMFKRKNKRKHKNSDPNMDRNWVIFGLLLLVCFLVCYFAEHLVFEFWITLLVFSITIYWGVAKLIFVETPPNVGMIIPLVLLLVFLCGFLLFFFAFLPTKSCHLKSATVATCSDTYERFGNSVPEPAPCSWNQRHILGLILVGEEKE
jgi:hypothetical protein